MHITFIGYSINKNHLHSINNKKESDKISKSDKLIKKQEEINKMDYEQKAKNEKICHQNPTYLHQNTDNEVNFDIWDDYHHIYFGI